MRSLMRIPTTSMWDLEIRPKNEEIRIIKLQRGLYKTKMSMEEGLHKTTNKSTVKTYFFNKQPYHFFQFYIYLRMSSGSEYSSTGLGRFPCKILSTSAIFHAEIGEAPIKNLIILSFCFYLFRKFSNLIASIFKTILNLLDLVSASNWTTWISSFKDYFGETSSFDFFCFTNFRADLKQTLVEKSLTTLEILLGSIEKDSQYDKTY